MPVSYNFKQKSLSLHNDITEESLKIITKILNEEDEYDVSFSNCSITLLDKLNLSKLRSLALDEMPVTDYTFLSDLHKLKSLRISFAQNKKEKNRVDSIPQLNTLNYLYLSNVSGVYKLPEFKNLNTLCLVDIKKEKLDFLPAFPNLKDLFLAGTTFDSHAPILNCKNLLRLVILDNRNINFREFENTPDIKSSIKILELALCTSLTSLSFLKKFPILKYLHIDSCHHIESFNGLQYCQNLEELGISNCKPKDRTLDYMTHITNVAVGGYGYKLEAVKKFEKSFKGRTYCIGRYEKGSFDYLERYEKHIKTPIEELESNI